MAKKKVKDKRRAKLKTQKKIEKLQAEMEAGFEMLDRLENALGETVRYKCLECGVEEEIPKEIVMQMDFEDGGDPLYPPRFKCEACPGQMEPIFYEGVHGHTYRFGEER